MTIAELIIKLTETAGRECQLDMPVMVSLDWETHDWRHDISSVRVEYVEPANGPFAEGYWQPTNLDNPHGREVLVIS